MKVHFKFKPKADKKSRRDVITTLRRHGVSGVRALFPDAPDDELARLYIADVRDGSQRDQALSLLKRSRVVEFAEPEAARRLIR
jgi:hypothetical protein